MKLGDELGVNVDGNADDVNELGRKVEDTTDDTSVLEADGVKLCGDEL